MRTPAASGRSTTSGSSIANEAREIPAAGRGEERVDDLALTYEVDLGHRAVPCTRRRARLASWRVASGDRPTMSAISSNGTANTSCSTNATRSAGASRSSTTSSAAPTESASERLMLGVVIAIRPPVELGRLRTARILLGRDFRDRSRSRQTREIDGGQPAAEVLDVAAVVAGEAQPGLLHGVVRFGVGAEHPVRDCVQVGSLFLGTRRRGSRSRRSSHDSDVPAQPEVTRPTA